MGDSEEERELADWAQSLRPRPLRNADPSTADRAFCAGITPSDEQETVALGTGSTRVELSKRHRKRLAERRHKERFREPPEKEAQANFQPLMPLFETTEEELHRVQGELSESESEEDKLLAAALSETYDLMPYPNGIRH